MQRSTLPSSLRGALKARVGLPARTSFVCKAAKTVHFEIFHPEFYGATVQITGSAPALGVWNPLNALQLTWSEGDIWSGSLELEEASSPIEYKYITRFSAEPDSEFKWQEGNNIILEIPTEAQSLKVVDDWMSGRLSLEPLSTPPIVAEASVKIPEEEPIMMEASPATTTNVKKEVEEEPILIPEPILGALALEEEKPVKVEEVKPAPAPALSFLSNIVPSGNVREPAASKGIVAKTIKRTVAARSSSGSKVALTSQKPKTPKTPSSK